MLRITVSWFAIVLLSCVACLAQQRPLITAADLTALLPHLQFEGRPVANADALALKLAPLRTTLATLSRDGRHLAYTVTEGPYTRIDIRSIDDPSQVYRVQLGDMSTAEIVSLQWTSPRRLVIATEDWTIGAVDLGNERIRILITPRIFKARLTQRVQITRSREEDPHNSYEMDRPAHLLGVLADATDSVLIESVVGDSVRNAFVETARLDVATGEWSFIDEARINSPAMRTVVDRQGRIRLLEDRVDLPFRWRVRELNAAGRPGGWSEIEKVIAPDLAARFEAPPEELWTHQNRPLGFAADPDVLYYASNTDSNTFSLRSLDLSTGQRTDFIVATEDLDLVDPSDEITPRAIGSTERFMRAENAAVYYTDFRPRAPRSPLILSRVDQRLLGVRTQDFAAGAHWLDKELDTVQAEIAAQFPGRRGVLIDWDDNRQRFLVRIESRNDPGRFFVYHRDARRWVEHLRLAPRLGPANLHRTVAFAATAADGQPLSGQLTIPNTSLITPPPLVVLFADGPWQNAQPGFNGAVQMLAEFGCSVLQFNYRGTAGLGRDLLLGARERPDELTASDVAAALDALAKEHPFDRRRVSLIGIGHGAWRALRVAELLPDRIRCVVSMNGHNDLSRLFASAPPRELPEGRNRNLELVENAVNYLDAVNSVVTSFGKSGKSADLRNLPSAEQAAPPTPDEPPPPSSVEGRAASQLQSFDFDAASSQSEENAFEDAYWATKRRLDLFQKMQDEIEATPIDPRAAFARWYFEPTMERDDDLSVLRHVSDLKAAVLICQEIHNPHAPTADATALKAALADARNPADYWEISTHAWSRPIDQRPEVWLQVARFFNENLYNFDVQIGTSVEVEGDVSP